MKQEVIQAIKAMSNNKAPGKDKIAEESVKHGGETIM